MTGTCGVGSVIDGRVGTTVSSFTNSLLPRDSSLRVHLHLVSDSTGETVTTVARACVTQFEGVVPVEHVWSFVRNRAQVDQVLSMVKALPGVVIYTLSFAGPAPGPSRGVPGAQHT